MGDRSPCRGDNLDRVLRTSDGGVTWSDVTIPEVVPAPDQPRRLGYFVDEQNAWVVYTGVFGDLGYAPAVVWRTQDGGSNWQPSRGAEPPSASEWFEPIALGFSAQGFGWLMAAIDAGINHQYIAVYTTARRWRLLGRVVDPYGEQPVQSCPKTGMVFVDARTGWMTRDCAGLMDVVTVIITTDGGVTWTETPLPAIPTLPGRVCLPEPVHATRSTPGLQPARDPWSSRAVSTWRLPQLPASGCRMGRMPSTGLQTAG